MHSERIERVSRFDGVERAVHWSIVGLSGVLVVTAVLLYVPSLAMAAGRRAVVRDLHVGAGFLLPVPLLVALAGRWGSRLQGDAAELSRWDAGDRAWLWSLGRAADAGAGKFNAGQKLNAAFTLGAMLVMLGTGSLLHWPQLFPLHWRTGATFVHDWLALGLGVVIAGHVAMALTHPESLRGMVTGRVGRGWAERRHPRWAVSGATGPTATGTVAPTRFPRLLAVTAGGAAVAAAASTLAPLFVSGGRGDGPAAVAERFQRALEQNDLEGAYELLSPVARSAGLSREAFFRQRIRQQDDRYVEPGEREPYARSVTVDHVRRAGGSAQVAVRVLMSDGRTIRRQINLSRAGGTWAVDRFFLLGMSDSCPDAASAASPEGCRHAR